ncbi:hypothetical protein PZB75_31350 (plasmid) [Streptomyces sp. AM 4-1-1]|uniref:hypothetical protein n=1 Tax=Streptomyces sp. AM 4-1-1 TaxID=3028710 RepID=UPI0023B8A930|nr:hypothetical protein [Streptomyces sp. AM 4-1-1]WEH37899.1 hypothetical protein PZB75_31350 [Streptomyces sp. AM 4-1-1]
MEQHIYPPDLVQAQIAFLRTYRALAADPRAFTTVRRRQLLHLSARVLFHPYWAGTVGRAHLEGLRRQARTLEQTPAA